MRHTANGWMMEILELRQLLSVVPQSVLDAGFEPIEWRGETVYAKPGQWLLQLKGVAGAPAAQLAKANGQLGRLNAAIRATRHLGRDGLLLVDAPRELTTRRCDRRWHGSWSGSGSSCSGRPATAPTRWRRCRTRR